jgi:hypothetical protein
MFFLLNCNVEGAKREGRPVARLTANCIDCAQQHTVDLDLSIYLAAKYGSRPSALQDLPYPDREFLIIGRCQLCGASKEPAFNPGARSRPDLRALPGR